MFTRLARFLIRRRRTVLVTALLGVLLAGAVGGGVAKHLSSGGFADPGAESEQAARIVEHTFHQGSPNLVLLVTARRGSVDDPAVAAEGARLTGELGRQPGVAEAASYWTMGSPPPLRSKHGNQALVIARIAGSQDQVSKRVKVISPRFQRQDRLVTVRVGGFAEVFRQVGSQIEKDLATAEGLAIPITVVLLMLVFGSVVAASLPLAIGVIAVLGTFLVLRTLAALTEVSIFSLNMTTAMGLGLAIDYSLFIVSRYREELRGGRSPQDAIVRSVETAGRTVAVSALTVAVSLAALLVFPLSFLRSFAYAGVAVVLLAAAGAVIVLPALLAVLGRNVDRWVLWHHEPKPVGEGFWHRMAMTVMRRPIPIATAIVIVLVVLGSPFLRVSLGLPDDRVLPTSASSRQVQDDIRRQFSSSESSATIVVAPGREATDTTAISAYAADLSKVAGVGRVDALTGSYVGGRQVAPASPVSTARFGSKAGTWLSVVPAVEALSDKGEAMVKGLRRVDAPFAVKVGGPSAQLVDEKASLLGRMPYAGLLIAAATFVLLFLMFGSVLVPVKALVLNVLSLSATFGAMVWIFQEGHLSKALDFSATGLLDTTTPILMFCIAFGLSMDYEVFLLSRIKEAYDRTGDNVAAVATGLEQTGRIVTAAAALLAVVFIAFATSKITFIKLFGVGLTMAVVMDATLIRATLVPAFMRLAGRANWWAPRPLRRLHERVGISESGPEPAGASL